MELLKQKRIFGDLTNLKGGFIDKKYLTKEKRIKYKFYLSDDDGNGEIFDYTDSRHNYEKNLEVNPKDIVYCLWNEYRTVEDCNANFEDLAEELTVELGYNVKKSLEVAKGLLDNYNKLNKIKIDWDFLEKAFERY